MALTSQTNTTLEQIASALAQYDTFAVCGHVNPDGDCLGSQLALALALESMGKHVDRILVRNEPIEAGLRFLPGADELIPAERYSGSPQVFIACDVPLRSRIGDAAGIHDRAKLRVTIDHHGVDSSMSELNYVDADAAACGLLVWELIGCLGVEVTAEMATCCYVALMTDTGRFQYQNTDAEVFSKACDMVAAGADPSICSREVYQRRSKASLMLEGIMLDKLGVSDGGLWCASWLTLDDFASCGAVKSDAEPLIDVIRSLDGVRVACILRDNGENVRGSLRAKDDGTDVSLLARFIGGGGHKAAAGFTFDGPIEEAVECMPAYLDALCALEDASDADAAAIAFAQVAEVFSGRSHVKGA